MGKKYATIIDATEPAAIVNKPVLRTKGSKTSVKAKAAQAVAEAIGGSDQLSVGTLETVKLETIVAEGRARRDMGDLKALARSMQEVGLVQPPLVDAQNNLVCGHRRVEAARLLGWEEIVVRRLDIEDPLALTVAEDAVRKDLTSSEKYAICETLRARAQEEGWRKSRFGGRLDEAHEKGRLDEAIAATMRLSRETMRKIRAIHAAAEADPTHFADLVEKLDADGRVDRHYRELERRKGRGGAAKAAAIVVAPGWATLFEVAEPKDIAKFARASMLAAGADEGTVLLIPSSVPALGQAASLVRQAGFEWRTTLRGSGGSGEELWLVAAQGRKAEIPPEATRLLAEGGAQGADAVVRATAAAIGGEVRLLDLTQEAGS